MSSIRSRRLTRGGLLALLVFAAFAAGPALSGAATFNVNTTTDNPPSAGECQGVAGDCSLRQAIDSANTTGGTNTVVVPAGTYALTLEAEGGDGIENGDLNVTDENLTIQGAGARQTILDAGQIEDRVINSEGASALALAGLTVTGGRTSDDGGGIYAEEGPLSLSGVAVTDNESFEGGYGGGLYAEGTVLAIVDSVFSGNRNSGDGGALTFYGSELILEDSTLADNLVDTALYPSSSGWGAYGGAMEADAQHLTMKNTTISGNEIIDGNGGEEGSGAAIEGEFETYEVVNSMIADNTGTEVSEVGQCTTTLGSLGHNLESEEPAGELRCFEEPTDIVADPLLVALADNGGETDTVALSAGSPAIDAGDAALCLPTDQRGYARPVGAGCDIGAFEFGAGPPATPATPVAPKVDGKPTTPLAGGWFGLKKAKHYPHGGTVKLGVKFSSAGQVTITGKGLKPAMREVAAGLDYIHLVPEGNLKARLMKAGKIKVKLHVSFTDAVAKSVYSKSHTVAFRLKR